MKKIFDNKSGRRGLGKKGFLGDLLFFTVFMFAFLIMVIFLHKVYTELHDDLFVTLGGGNSSSQAAIALQSGQTTFNGMDFIFVMVLILLGLGVIVSAFQIDTHPIFFFLMLTLFLGMLVVAVILSDTMSQFQHSGLLTNESGTYQMSFGIFNNLPLILFLFIIVIAVLFFGKIRAG